MQFMLTIYHHYNTIIDDKQGNGMKGDDSIRTFVYSELPDKEKDKFMEFMINNNVEFVQDNDNNYIATI